MESFNLSEDELARFLEEGIEGESFDLLDEETIAKLYPKAGPRLLFKKKFYEYKRNKEIKILAEVPINLPSPSYTTSSDTVTINSDDPIVEIVDDIWTNQYFENKEQENNKRGNDDNDDICSTPKRLNIIDINDIFDTGLQNVLKNSIDGRIVLARKHNLNNDARQRLVKEIINYLVDKVGVEGVRTFMLSQAAEEVPKIFPNESKETYYIPYLPKSPTCLKKAAKGKLWSRFVNVRNAIKTAEKSLNKTKTPPKRDYSDKDDIELQLLSTLIEPKDRVLTLWKNTLEQRRFLLRSSSLTVQELFERYAALSTSIGPDLVEIDFNCKYGEKADLIHSKLPALANAILAEASLRKICVVSEENADPIVKALLTLPYLFGPITIKNKRKAGNWRPSRSETAESFFLHIENFEELQENKCQRLQKLNEYNLTLQPFGVICGPLKKVEKYLVLINDTIYTFDSIVRCVEILYKAFHALDIQYPHESEPCWQLLEELVFEMKVSPSNSSVTALTSDLKKFF